MENIYIRDRKGRVIGKLDDKYVRDPNNRLLGRYQKESDRTFDANGTYVGKGDLRKALLDVR